MIVKFPNERQSMIEAETAQSRFNGLPAVAGLLLCGLASIPSHGNETVAIEATPIQTFMKAAVGTRVGNLVWQGGLQLRAENDDFGGLSGLSFIDHEQFVAVSDKGYFVSGRLLHSKTGEPVGLSDVGMTPTLDENGEEIKDRAGRDAEAVEVVFAHGEPVTVRVGFERRTRVADYQLERGRPRGTAVPITIPEWMEEIDNNYGIESVCIAPPRSSIAGQTLVITENFELDSDDRAAALLAPTGSVNLAIGKTSGVRPSDCTFLPNGDLLVLMRDERKPEIAMQIMRLAAADIYEGAIMEGALVVDASSPDVANMEGLAVRVTPDGEIRLVIISDDGFEPGVPTLLLEFSLIDMHS